MQILAHRGIMNSYPENSRAALISAVHSEFAIETDLQMTKDGFFLLSHDESLDRLSGQDVRVADLSLADATQYRYINSDQQFISLRMLLEQVKIEAQHPFLALHLKRENHNLRAYQALSTIWKQYNLFNNAFVFGLTPQAAQECKQIDPEIDIGYIVSEEKFSPEVYLWDEVKNDRNFDIVWAAEYQSFYTQELILDMQKIKGRVYAMSPDVHVDLGHPLANAGYEKTWKKLIEWNVNGICTDQPYKLQQLLKTQTT